MTSPALRAVLWDFGGVITTSPFDAFARYEAGHGLPDGFLRTLNATDPHDNAWARLERSEVDLPTFARLFEAEAAAAGGEVDAMEVVASLAGEVRPTVVEAVRRCHQHLKTALITNNFLVGGDTTDFGDALDHFDVIVESARVGVRKPDPRIYTSACDQLGVSPHEAVMLDDLGVNLKPARALGMHTIKVVDPDVALDELEALVGFPLR